MCDERERLIGYVYDECDADERRAIASHLEECGTCRAEIGALRGVRQDLLAWEVPEPRSVWRPYIAPAVQPWYRQIPTWALAAAATVMFAVGLTGGLVANAFSSRPDAAATVAQVAPVSSDASELAEQRLFDRLRAELALAVASRQPQAVPVSDTSHDQLMQRMNQIVSDSEQRQTETVLQIARELSVTSSNTSVQVKRLQEALTQLAEAFANQGGR